MSPLRARMIEEMTLAGLAVGTQKIYIQAVRRLAAHCRRSPDELGEEEVRVTPRPEVEVGPGGLEDGFVMVSGLGPSRSASGAATLRGRLGGRAG